MVSWKLILPGPCNRAGQWSQTSRRFRSSKPQKTEAHNSTHPARRTRSLLVLTYLEDSRETIPVGLDAIGILTCASLAFSQTATTSLRGVVKDPTGALVPGATVSIARHPPGFRNRPRAIPPASTISLQILPARYTIKVNAAGFGQQTKSAELLVNQPATIDFTLSVQSSTVTVDVSASAQTLNTTDASLGTSDDSAEIQALPSETRNVPELLSLQPGVLYLPRQPPTTAAAAR